MANKRTRYDNDITIYDQMQSKRNRIMNKFLHVIDNPNEEISKKYNIKINTVNLNINVGIYNVQIYNVSENIAENTKFKCSCNPTGVYMNFTNNYCKHINYALSELIRIYVKENENYFKEKKLDTELKENIEVLFSNFSKIDI
jgi:hypothetical protein